MNATNGIVRRTVSPRDCAVPCTASASRHLATVATSPGKYRRGKYSPGKYSPGKHWRGTDRRGTDRRGTDRRGTDRRATTVNTVEV